MNNKSRNLGDICLRYVILLFILVGVYYWQPLYTLIFNLTVYPTSFFLNLAFNSRVFDSFIIVNQTLINIIPACIAISAYGLLLILNLTTAMKLKTRIYSLIFSLSGLLLLNIMRIIFMALLLINDYSNFEFVHRISWYALGIVFVTGIWFLTAHIFKISTIPVYSDIKSIIKPNKK